MATRREVLMGGLATAILAGGFERLAAQGQLPPKSPVGIATTANGMHLRGVPGLFESLRADPVRYLEYCRSLGAGGVQHAVSTDIPRFRKRLEELGMYYEGEARLPATLDGDTTEFERAIMNARELGAITVRAVSRPPQGTSGRRYEGFTSLAQFQEWQRTANAIVEKCLPIAAKHRVAIALENHKDRAVEDHAAFLQRISSEWLGALIDPGNNMSFMEEPEQTVRALAPFVKATSLKDMGVAPYEQGFLLSEVRFGQGVTDQKALFAEMRRHNPRVNPIAELITRDPLKIPVLTDDYYRSFPPAQRERRDRWMAMVRAKQTALPTVSGLSPAQQLQAEEDNNRSTFTWGLQNLT